ncbi:MAG: serine--tRNA ligase [Chitinophagales bacterium]|nr:serine--tRNA ligase [Chitinophagales bacterium]
MIDVQYLRDHFKVAQVGLEKRNIPNVEALLNEVIALDDKRKASQFDLDEVLAQSNKLSKEIGDLFKQGKREEAESLKAQTAELKEKSKILQDEQQSVLEALEEKLLQIPNIPHVSVPLGKTPEDNEVVRQWGDFPTLAQDNELPHWELATKYQIFDLELGVKLTGAGFPVYKGKGAQLQRGLINFFLNKAIEAGYEEVIPPLMVNEASARATGQLPDKEAQMYEMKNDPFYMIPTAEVPITNIYRDELLNENQFPVKMVGYTPCFRREAGSYGAHVRGLNRLHQFDKVEIVQIEHPNKSYETLEKMLNHVESLVQALGLPYRVLRLCGGDMGFVSALTYDIEVYSAAQKRWLEVSSISNFETYQANRLKLRYKDADGKRALAHTLNGSALALPRIVAALLENNQTPNGIKMPEAIIPFVGFSILN